MNFKTFFCVVMAMSAGYLARIYIPHDAGTIYLADGKKYFGIYGFFNGKAKQIWSDGTIYIGEHYKGRPHGEGALYIDSIIFKGTFKYCQLSKGSITYSNMATYVGDIKDYAPHGYGVLTWKNGKKYKGEWKEGFPYGKGIFYFPNGNKYVGKFKKGDFCGRGTFYWADGSKYFGKFKDDLKHGQGILYDSDGTIHQIGYWRKNKYIGKKK